jgi:RNA polymerase sigma-70 factor (sigma-E family)
LDEEFPEFVRSRLATLSRIAYLLTNDHHAAEDLLQSALVKVAARWSRVRAADDPVAYIRKILYHEHVSAWRSRRRELRPAEDGAVLVPAGRDEASEVVARVVLQAALAKLTPRQRAVIVLRYFEDLSERATAEALGCSIGTVKSQTSHALGRLRLLAPELAGPIHAQMEVGQ